MAGSVMVVKNILEDLIGKCLKSQYFKTGDGLAREVGRNLRMLVKFETGEQTRDGCKGFSATCSGYDVETMAWHGSKSGAENLAGWKWIREVCYRSAVDKNLYRQLVKKFTFSIVDVETSCRMCKEAVDLEELWDHVERCMEVRRINYWHERQTNDTKQCLFCKQWVTLFEMDDHLEECRWKDCVKCGLRIEKLEEVAHLNQCEPTVVNLIACPMCPQRLEAHELERHWLVCVGRNRRCKLCGELEEPGHNCFECAICIEKKPVKDWVVFGKCGHVVCRACSRRLERCDNGKKVVCVKCREKSFYPLKRIYL